MPDYWRALALPYEAVLQHLHGDLFVKKATFEYHASTGVAPIRAVRGRGLLAGIELDPAVEDARSFCERLLRHGVLSKDTHHTVVRLAPPLTITQEELDHGLDAVQAAFEELALTN